MNDYTGQKINLYEWQKECLEKWFGNNCRGVINVATGAGKTVLALAAVKSLEEKLYKNNPENRLKVKIIVPKIFLAGQWVNMLTSVLGVKRGEIGLYHGQQKENKNRRYMIYVVNSARYSVSSHILNDYNDNCRVLLICDECHHFGSAENSKIFDFVPYIQADMFYSMGLSATPDLNNPALLNCLGGEIYKYGFDKAVKTGVVADYEVFNISLSFQDEESDEYLEFTDQLNNLFAKLIDLKPYLKNCKNDKFYTELQKIAETKTDGASDYASAALITLYKRKEVVYLAKNRIYCAEDLIKMLPDNRIIVFSERISAADELYEKLKKTVLGKNTGRYHSEMGSEAKKSALERYKTGEINILLSCRALDEGLNVPETDTGIIMSSTGSARQRVQRVGRVLRKTGGNEKKSIYYMYIGDSIEEREMIPGDKNSRKFELHYKTSGFTSEEYDYLCETALCRLIQNNTPSAILDEVKNNFKLGVIKSDWRRKEAECRAMIEKSLTVREKNYWICMLKLAEANSEIIRSP